MHVSQCMEVLHGANHGMHPSRCLPSSLMPSVHKQSAGTKNVFLVFLACADINGPQQLHHYQQQLPRPLPAKFHLITTGRQLPSFRGARVFGSQSMCLHVDSAQHVSQHASSWSTCSQSSSPVTWTHSVSSALIDCLGDSRGLIRVLSRGMFLSR